MPTGVFLIWPALHLFYGLTEVHSHKVSLKRRLAGIVLLLLSLTLMGQPFGWEQGVFYWLFAVMAAGLSFVQLRVWQPKWVRFITSTFLVLLIISGVSYGGR